MKLEAGKVAGVTGAASGRGLALAERFARDGLNVVLADVEEPVLASASEQIGALGVETLAVPTDVSENAAVQAGDPDWDAARAAWNLTGWTTCPR